MINLAIKGVDMRIFVSSILSFALTCVTAGNALADNSRYNHTNINDQRYDQHRNVDEKAVATGIIGLTAGIIIGNSISNNNRYSTRHFNPAHPPKLHYNQRLNNKKWGYPYSPEWYRYCANEHRSFNPKSGTYRDRKGRTQFCYIPPHIRSNR